MKEFREEAVQQIPGQDYTFNGMPERLGQVARIMYKRVKLVNPTLEEQDIGGYRQPCVSYDLELAFVGAVAGVVHCPGLYLREP